MAFNHRQHELIAADRGNFHLVDFFPRPNAWNSQTPTSTANDFAVFIIFFTLCLIPVICYFLAAQSPANPATPDPNEPSDEDDRADQDAKPVDEDPDPK